MITFDKTHRKHALENILINTCLYHFERIGFTRIINFCYSRRRSLDMRGISLGFPRFIWNLEPIWSGDYIEVSHIHFIQNPIDYTRMRRNSLCSS